MPRRFPPIKAMRVEMDGDSTVHESLKPRYGFISGIRRGIGGIGGCIALAASIAWGQDKPAEAVEAPRAAPAAEAVVDDDPFRYLEDLASPRTQAFLREQAAQARAALDRIPGRNAMAERIRALSESGATVSSLALAAGRVFYLKAAPRQARPVP